MVDLETGASSRILDGIKVGVVLAFSLDGRLVAANGIGAVHLWDRRARKEIAALRSNDATRLMFSHDSRMLTTADCLWDMTTFQPLIQPVTLALTDFGPDDQTLVGIGASTQSELQFFKILRDEYFRQFGQDAGVGAVESQAGTIHPDGRTNVAGLVRWVATQRGGAVRTIRGAMRALKALEEAVAA